MIRRLRTWMRWLEVDRAVTFGVAAGFVQTAAAPVTIILIARHLTPETQGFYYTFASLLALRSWGELGLGTVVVNNASHEWARLSLDERGRIVGDPSALSRLVSLGRMIFKWYAVGGAVFVGGVGFAGYIMFSRETGAGVSWLGPWLLLVVLSGVTLWSLPFHALLEGCDQVATIQRFRLTERLVLYAALWLTLVLGGHLWAAAAAAGATIFRDAYLLGVQYRRFFGPFLSKPSGAVIRWKHELLPMQWRMALSDLAGYFLFNAFTPVMFHFHGPTVAGQVGMTMSMILGLQRLAANWLPPKVPKFGMLIAQREYVALDRLWLRTLRASVAVAGSGAGAAWLMVFGLDAFHVPLADRLLSPLPTAMFLAATVFVAVGYCEAAYLRAHKQEPLMVLSVGTAVLMAALVWALGSRFGPTGAAAAYLVVMGGISVPWETFIWFRKRAEWHAADAQALRSAPSAQELAGQP